MASAQSAGLTESAAGVCRVLVADDHPVHQQLARTMLEALGCDVRIVEDGFDAVAVAAETPFQVIILERHMRYAGGDVASLLIRSGGASKAGLIACYSTDRPADAEAALYDHILPKPAPLETMLALLKLAQVRASRPWRLGF